MSALPVDLARWQRLEELLTRALDRPEPERLALVTAECGDDIEMRDEIMGLLGAGPSDSLHDIVAASARSAAREVPLQRESSPPPPSLLPIVVTFLAIVIA